MQKSNLCHLLSLRSYLSDVLVGAAIKKHKHTCERRSAAT
jgi:hypothetical protein